MLILKGIDGEIDGEILDKDLHPTHDAGSSPPGWGLTFLEN